MSAKTKTTTGTYDRAAVPAERCGQCPCCLRAIRSSKSGKLVRHGWKEEGRVVGEHGRGFQFGECLGSGMRPLEQTDADAILVLRRLADSIDSAERELAVDRKGRESYPSTITVWTYYEERTAAQAREVAKELRKLGCSFEEIETKVRRQGPRTTYVPGVLFRVAVLRGAEEIQVAGPSGSRLPSYEEFRTRAVGTLEDVITKLEAQEKAIEAAVRHHAANPSNGTADPTRRGNLIHFDLVRVRSIETSRPGATLEQRTSRGAACGKSSRTLRGQINVAKTTDRAAVTCAKCLAKLGGK